MNEPFSNPENAEDLHALMAIAVLCGHRSIEADVSSVYEAWALSYPNDALGGIGRGLDMIGKGQVRDGYKLIKETANTATTRSEQARDVLASLSDNMRAMTD